MITGIAIGVLVTLFVMNAIADQRAGVWDRHQPQRLDITDALKRQDRIRELSVQRRALEVEDKVLRERRPEAN